MTEPRRPAKKVPAKKPAKRTTPTKKTAATRQPAAKRDDQVLKLRDGGATFEAIARKLRFKDATGAHIAYERALAKSLPESPEKTKRAELERIRKAEDLLWPKAERGDLGAIAKLVQLDHERQMVTRDQVVITTEDHGPIEAATLQEVKRLEGVAPALAATAVVLARIVDDNREPGPTATAAREHRMQMSQLRGLAGTNPAYGKPPPTAPEDDAPKEPGQKGGGRVVPETRLDELRRRAAERAQGAEA